MPSLNNIQLLPTQRVIAHTTDRGHTEDMLHEYNGNESGILNNIKTMSDNDLIQKMRDLFYWCTYFDNDLKSVGDKMINKFINREGGQFRDPVLNEKVMESSAFKNFSRNVAKAIGDELRKNNNDITKVDINMKSERPIFNGAYNKFNGLQILINDTEYTEVFLNDHTTLPDGRKEVTVIFVIHDHFGLDKADALNYQDKNAGFAAWWELQHKRNYYPFETIVTVAQKYTFSK